VNQERREYINRRQRERRKGIYLKKVEYCGRVDTLVNHAKRQRLPYQTVRRRLNIGWSLFDALTERSVRAKAKDERKWRNKVEKAIMKVTEWRKNSTEKRIIAKHKKRKPTLPCSYTFPVLGKRKDGKSNDLEKIMIKYERRKRWALLKKELGEDYLNDLHRQCTVEMRISA
jgi:hypothetical protein